LKAFLVLMKLLSLSQFYAPKFNFLSANKVSVLQDQSIGAPVLI